MREILFRGKRKDNGEWIEGHLLWCENGRAVITPRHTEVRNVKHEELSDCLIVHIACEVDPESISEFTGLTDKNGKKIFEGDIVNCCSFAGINDFEKCLVGWSDLLLCFRADTHSLYGDSGREYEVIGTIHDNPELLKGGVEE